MLILGGGGGGVSCSYLAVDVHLAAIDEVVHHPTRGREACLSNTLAGFLILLQRSLVAVDGDVASSKVEWRQLLVSSLHFGV